MLPSGQRRTHLKRAAICLAIGTCVAYALAVALATDPPRMNTVWSFGSMSFAPGIGITDYHLLGMQGELFGRAQVAELRKVTGPGVPGQFNAVVSSSAGLPLHCVAASLHAVPDPGLPTRVVSSSVSVRGGYLTSRSSALLQMSPAVEVDALALVALRPLPLRLLANGAVIGAVWFVPSAIFHAAVRCRRRTRGQCLDCGYPLATDVCSECGRAVQRPTAPELPRAQT